MWAYIEEERLSDNCNAEPLSIRHRKHERKVNEDQTVTRRESHKRDNRVLTLKYITSKSKLRYTASVRYMKDKTTSNSTEIQHVHYWLRVIPSGNMTIIK